MFDVDVCKYSPNIVSNPIPTLYVSYQFTSSTPVSFLPSAITVCACTVSPRKLLQYAPLLPSHSVSLNLLYHNSPLTSSPPSSSSNPAAPSFHSDHFDSVRARSWNASRLCLDTPSTMALCSRIHSNAGSACFTDRTKCANKLARFPALSSVRSAAATVPIGICVASATTKMHIKCNHKLDDIITRALSRLRPLPLHMWRVHIC